MHKVVFDTETTGLIKPDVNDINEQPYIAEFYAVKIDEDFNLIDEIGGFLKPPVPLSEKITKITGITNEMIADAPSFADFSQDLEKFFVGVDEMIAHNLPFDRNMLANELVRAGRLLHFPWPPKHTCTVAASMGIEQRRINLTKLHHYATGKDFPAHRAKDDVYALVRSYHWLCEEGILK